MRVSIPALAALALLAVGARATTLVQGSELPPLTLTDQHDVAATIGSDTHFIVLTRDMDAGDLVKATLAERPDLLQSAQVVYVADISGMPSIIAKLFAVPAMRKRPYRILLDRDGKATAGFPSIEGRATLIGVVNMSVQSVTYIDSSAALLEALRPVRR